VIYLHDDKGEMQDKFKAKGNSQHADGVDHPFVVNGMAYSPDSARLALAQSDDILYIYKLGLVWKEKKSISNKFVTQVRYCSHLSVTL
jgi:intraflagellar transport protein 172